ncbi:hypothetical protein FVF58_19140 [Paraburkholderia panacisoli]|uniref:Uncharacterized protein n=1 Tax=Paraburkholderia panacisoli TaxID=2603818 RepID=A0A5B0H5H1_9BURK|nr:hypothetical protein FVF58_19140 [Paraburkholderia panacisoli]
MRGGNLGERDGHGGLQLYRTVSSRLYRYCAGRRRYIREAAQGGDAARAQPDNGPAARTRFRRHRRLTHPHGPPIRQTVMLTAPAAPPAPQRVYRSA